MLVRRMQPRFARALSTRRVYKASDDPAIVRKQPPPRPSGAPQTDPPRNQPVQDDTQRKQVRKALCIFLGAPGSGKGTYSSKIAPVFGWQVVSTGDIIRNAIKNNTLEQQHVSAVNRGQLLPDGLIVDIIGKQLATQKNDMKGLLLDGFPRTLKQAEVLQKLCPVTVAFNVVVPEEAVVVKALARRACNNCNKQYNLADVRMEQQGVFMPPILPTNGGSSHCDCGGLLEKRDDDTEEVVRHRLSVYTEHAAPLVEFYSQQRVLFDYHVQRGVDDMVWLLPQLKRFLDRT